MIRGRDFFPLFFSFSPWKGVEGAAGDKGLLCEGPGRLKGGGLSPLCPACGVVQFPDVAGLARTALGPREHRTARAAQQTFPSLPLPGPSQLPRCGKRGARGRRAEGWAFLAPTFPAPVGLPGAAIPHGSSPRRGRAAAPGLRGEPAAPGRALPSLWPAPAERPRRGARSGRSRPSPRRRGPRSPGAPSLC